MKVKAIALASIGTMVAAGMLVGTVFMASPATASPETGVILSESPVTVEEVIQEGDRNVLKVKNRTPFIVILNVGGVRVGWMRPYRTGIIRGLTPGYHKLYAHSRYGTMSWGPRDVWVPGNWNLLY